MFYRIQKGKRKLQNWFQKKRNIVLGAVICTFLWGCAFPAVKLGYQIFSIDSDDVASQMLFAGIRFFTAGIVTLLIAAVSQRKFPGIPRHYVPGTVLLGIVQTALQYLCFYVGLAHTTGTRGSILNATSTFMTIILVGIVWPKKEPITLRKLLGCIIGLGGVVLVNLSGLSTSQPFTFLGEGMVLLSALCLSLSALLTKVLSKGTNPLSLTGWHLTIGGFLLLICGLISGGKLENVGWQGILLLAFMVLISSVAFPIWTFLLKYNPVSQISVYNFLIPVFGVILSSLVLGEGFPGISCILALLLVCAGIILVNREKKPESKQAG